MRRTTITLVLAAGLALAGCNSRNGEAIDNATAAAGTSQDAVAALGGTDRLGTMARLVKQAGLNRALSGVGSYTIFAPDDAAFAQLPEATRQTLETDAGRPQLIALLRRHMASGYIAQDDLTQGLDGGTVRVAVLAGPPLDVRRDGGAIALGAGENAPKIVGAPVIARNAVIYRIDRLLPPPAK